MDIQQWLKEALKKVKNSEPSELIKQMEKHGLVEKDLNAKS